MNKPCLNKQTSISCQNHAQQNRYDDPGKSMK